MLPTFIEWRNWPENKKRFPLGHKGDAKREYNRLQKEEAEKKMSDAKSIWFSSPKTSSVVLGTIEVDCPLACVKTKPCPPPAIDWSGYQEGNNPMNSYATATVQAGTTETQDQRKYLEKRLYEVYSEKRDPLEATFGLIDDEAPNTVDEFKKRIADGSYTFRTGDQYRYWSWMDLIQWRHPDRKRDDEGFKAALEDLKAARQKALDDIKIKDPETGLKAVIDLESWEPTGKAN
jgi:hypothetical protein